jgi:hypothetical protein
LSVALTLVPGVTVIIPVCLLKWAAVVKPSKYVVATLFPVKVAKPGLVPDAARIRLAYSRNTFCEIVKAPMRVSARSS